MAIFSKLLTNRNFILVLSIVLGLAIGRVAIWTQPLVLPVIALIMTLSTASIASGDLISLKTMPSRILISLLLNYLILGGIILLMARWLINDNELWVGFVIIAAVPPAVALVPFSFVLGGDTTFSLMGMIGTYLAALVLTPVVMMLFLGVDFFNPARLVVMLLQLIVIPLIASRILLFTGLTQRIERWRGTIVNWSFFVVLFTIIGLNRDVFFGQFEVLLRMAIIAVTITFVLGYAIELIANALHINQATNISLILIGTMKNYGLASAIALTLFSERASIPGSICIVFAVLRMVWLLFHFRKPG
jgi:BASS family bile acid:Na+ symporter